ncbi:MAG: gamma-glutamyltransferase [Rhodospirillaceae bacterium]
MTKKQGAVAAGDHHTAQAAQTVLAAGGNAFDAALAGIAASFLAEPVLSSPGGGGFMMARLGAETGAPKTVLYDFFAQTPLNKTLAEPDQTLDFHPVLADFGGGNTQEFHVGSAAIATPGMMPGMAAIHHDLCRLPLKDILAPALALAQNGCPVSPLQADFLQVVAPIMLFSPEARAAFECLENPGQPLPAGEKARVAGLVDCLDLFAQEGERPFREGDPAQDLVALCRSQGGLLSLEDLKSFTVIRRTPLRQRVAGMGRVMLNPPPSSGGPLIAFALALMEGQLGEDWAMEGLLRARAMAATADARAACALLDETTEDRVSQLLDPQTVARFRQDLELDHGRALKVGGTTHLSVIDGAGNAAAVSLSNGEGCGRMLPCWGYMPNNMLGEEDINPRGWFAWDPNRRISSMMAPTLVEEPDGSLLALGSGGSNRIRSAITQVLRNTCVMGLPLADAVGAPRLHVEGDLLNIEAGFAENEISVLRSGFNGRVKAWDRSSMFFGGVHAVRRRPDGSIEAAGDPRRGGATATA